MEGGGAAGVTNMVVLSDGAVGMLFGHTKRGRTQDLTVNAGDGGANATMEFLHSKDGGETLEPSVIVSPFFMDRPRSEGANIGQLAVDATEGPFKDRLYAVWPDAREDRVQLFFSHSADKGKSWSPAMAVNDDRSFADMEKKRDHILPAVAVNKEGVVAVTWYDRRDSPDNLGVESPDRRLLRRRRDLHLQRPGVERAERLRRRGPLAPGEYGMTDSATATVTMALRLDLFFESGGHTTGLVAGADGVFHPVWVDNRTGVAQMWTAPVTIEGEGDRERLSGAGWLREHLQEGGRRRAIPPPSTAPRTPRRPRCASRISPKTRSRARSNGG